MFHELHEAKKNEQARHTTLVAVILIFYLFLNKLNSKHIF